MKFLLIISSLFVATLAYAQPSAIDLRIRKSLRDKLDDIVFELQVSGRLDDEEAQQRFKEIFTQDAQIYDFITPNYINQKTGREMTKSVPDFVKDVRRDFPRGFQQFQVAQTNLGTAVNYDAINWRDPQIQLIIELNLAGDYFRGGVFSNQPVLDFRLSFDTINNQVTNMLITDVRKVESALMYQKEEKLPFFEKQLMVSALNSYVDVNSISIYEGAQSIDYEYFVYPVEITPEYSYSASIHLIRRFAAPEPEEFAWSVGLGVTETNFRASVENYFYSSVETDFDDDQYFLSITGREFDELVRLRIVDMPIRFRYERRFTNVLGFYVNPGVNLSYLVQTSYFGSGIFSYTGYFPQFQLLLENEEDRNFVSNSEQEGDNTMPIPQWNWDDFNVSGALEIGFNIEFRSGLMLYLGANAFKNIVYIKEQVEDHAISTTRGEYRGIAPLLTSIDNGGYGFHIGIRKRFVSKNGLVKLE